MANMLNYKYEIFPTEPQRTQLNRVLREARIQWNKAVTVRKKLKTALVTGQLEHVLKTCLSSNKSNNQGQRKKAILKFQKSDAKFEKLAFDDAARLYDIKNLLGNVLEVDSRHLDISTLVKELKEKYDSELAARKEAQKNGVEREKLPKLTTYWRMIGAINSYAGFAAKRFMDKSFRSPKGMSLSTVRANISGYKSSIRWNQAVNPKKGQRAYGATGEPQYKRRGEGFTYQIQSEGVNKLLRSKNGKSQIHITSLYQGNAWINMAYHRPIPEDGMIKQFTVSERAGRYFTVLSVDAPDHAWDITPLKAGWHAGIDPGAKTALTVGLKNSQNGELKHLAIHYEFLEKSLDRLEKIQQALDSKQKPRRKRTEEEIEAAVSKFTAKSSVKKLSPVERKKAIEKEKGRLERRMIFQQPSKRWRRWTKKVSALQFKIANQRADVLHKISRALAEGCDVIGIGHWEPERQVSYRKQLRRLKKRVRLGIEGAKEGLKALQEEKSKQGPKGAKKKRRGARDRSIATLRRLVEEKAHRAQTTALTSVDESGSTYTCNICGEATGPRGRENLSVRVWRCEKCNTLHHRDLNSAFNILKKTEKEIAAAQAAIPETESTIAGTITQGAQVRPVSTGDGSLATGLSGRGDSFFYEEHGEAALPNLWSGDVPKALKSLIDMGIAKPLSMQSEAETAPKTPP